MHRAGRCVIESSLVPEYGNGTGTPVCVFTNSVNASFVLKFLKQSPSLKPGHLRRELFCVPTNTTAWGVPIMKTTERKATRSQSYRDSRKDDKAFLPRRLSRKKAMAVIAGCSRANFPYGRSPRDLHEPADGSQLRYIRFRLSFLQKCAAETKPELITLSLKSFATKKCPLRGLISN